MRSEREIRERIARIAGIRSDAYDDHDEGGVVQDAEFLGYREALEWVLEEDENDPFE